MKESSSLLLSVALCDQTELRGALIELGEVEHAVEDVMGLLQQVETDLQQFGEVYGDPRHIEVHLRKIQVRWSVIYYYYAARMSNTSPVKGMSFRD